MRREVLIWLLAGLGLALGGWWLALNTEWVEESRPRAAIGEALDNPLYAAERLLRQLRMTVEHRESLEVLPPRGARLVLMSADWQLRPALGEQLQRWVRQGGHLVLMRGADWADSPLAAWVPVDDEEPDEGARRSPRPPKRSETDIRMPLVSSPPLWGDTGTLLACNALPLHRTLAPQAGHAPSWQLTGTQPTRITQALRLPLGQGSVTVLSAQAHLFHNPSVLRCDHALLLAAAVQAEPGATAWFYVQEKRESLLSWLWRQGLVAIVAGALALAAALWRASVRFGPWLAPAPRLRRSISEQVRGLGAYLLRSGHEALLGAQQRALEDAAARRLPKYRQLPVPERARVIAAAADLPADELLAALSTRFCTRVQLLRYLPLLETARRRLLRPSDERRTP
ncbi:DUF4350 domain-containing protein [Roseateles sp. BYS96W]|uniref:DUF4350 domain-containing protein n=1 Tax=Pelomonas nitida TaxID=3299027 RepID=A0ABW7GAJ2_9BURK